jgi:hypothetical protein
MSIIAGGDENEQIIGPAFKIGEEALVHGLLFFDGLPTSLHG